MNPIPPLNVPAPLALNAPPAPPVNVQQPNWGNMSNAFATLAAEMPHVANVNPMPLVQATQNDITTLVTNYNTTNTAIFGALNALIATLNATQATVNANQAGILANQASIAATQATLAATQVTVNATQATLAATQVTVNANQAVLNGVLIELTLLPMRLYNISTSDRAPLQYPAGFAPVPGGPLPITRADLMALTGVSADNVLNALAGAPGLQPPPVNAPALARVTHLRLYLGVC
ncbi:hypothetical protein CPB85DRAFT_1440784 [Mucidula mucida]|nr:hypothetical protein CPB85DRAFT_1440784 [Mucidula mucida]